MNREEFLKELSYLLQDISEQERNEALQYYEDYFDDAGEENEEKVILELGDPSRIAAVIKDGLKGKFEENIQSGNDGFENSDYRSQYEVVDHDHPRKSNNSRWGSLKEKWNQLENRDRILLIIIAVIAIVPFSFPFMGVVGGLFGIAFAVGLTLFMFIFGFWILTVLFYIIGIIAIIVGISHLFITFGTGLIYLGVGVLLIAFGQIFSQIAKWFSKTLIPSIVDFFSNLYHGVVGEKESAS